MQASKAKIPIIFFLQYFEDLTLSTHYKYRKLVRFHHKFIPNSFQFCTVSLKKSHKEQYIHICILFFFIFFFNQNLIDMFVYVCVKQALCSNNTYESIGIC